MACNTCNNSCRQKICGALFGTGCCCNDNSLSQATCRERIKEALADVAMKTHPNTCLQEALSVSHCNCCCPCFCCCMTPPGAPISPRPPIMPFPSAGGCG